MTKDYETYMRETARFYTNEKAQAEYRNVIRTFINRKNTVTGKPYAGDPVIMSWQLANEPRPGNASSTPQEKEIYVKWIADTAAYIRGLDKNHLVSTGSEGLAGSAHDAELFEKAHASKDVDYLTYHLWPKNWGWIDSKRVDATWSGALEKSSHYLNVHIDYAKKIGKGPSQEAAKEALGRLQIAESSSAGLIKIARAFGDVSAKGSPRPGTRDAAAAALALAVADQPHDWAPRRTSSDSSPLTVR